MTKILSLLLISALFSLPHTGSAVLAEAPCGRPAPLSLAAGSRQQPSRLFWGLIDPELSAWFARSPADADSLPPRILWDWTWRAFIAAIEEAIAHAPDC